jgi:hypothetical protein
MTKKELEAFIEKYKEEIEESGVERPLTDEEIEALDYIDDKEIPEEYRGSMSAYYDRDFGRFEELPHLLRNYLGALELRRFRYKFGENPSLEDEEVRQYLDENLMNAALRAGISAEKNQDSTKESAMALDTYMNAGLMKKTMMPTPEFNRIVLADYYNEEQVDSMIEQNMARQLVMAKTMLLAQLGKYDVVNKNGLDKGLDVPVYETLVHGNRTNFILPMGEESGEVLDAFMGQNGGADAGIEERTAATHSVKRRKIGQNGMLRSDSKEERTYNPFKIFGNQYGMNIAVGGIGSKGPDKKIITGNGEAGHLYMRAEKGDEKHCGSLLIGIEGSEPGKSNYLGNSHGIRAKSAKQSAFLADKSIVGKKIGGRQVDLSGIDANDLAGILNEFAEKYSQLQRGATTEEGRERIANINDMLMGKYMTADKLKEMFGALGMAGERLHDMIAQARNGYMSKINVKEITDEEFKQSIRRGFSQDKACAIAEARFERAGDSLELSVGAIKELMYTHETRSIGWKIRHPIKNYLEYSKINSLTKKLQTEKGFERADIASAMRYYDDSFSMDWGDELSNDRDAIRFAKSNKYAFKKSENKLSDVLKKASDAIGIKTVASEEVKEMQEELARVLEGKSPDREQIAVEEEDEANKNMDISMDIIPEQPEINKTMEL